MEGDRDPEETAKETVAPHPWGGMRVEGPQIDTEGARAPTPPRMPARRPSDRALGGRDASGKETRMGVIKSGWGLMLKTGDKNVPGTRRQECLRYVAQAFQPAGSGDFPVASSRK